MTKSDDIRVLADASKKAYRALEDTVTPIFEQFYRFLVTERIPPVYLAGDKTRTDLMAYSPDPSENVYPEVDGIMFNAFSDGDSLALVLPYAYIEDPTGWEEAIIRRITDDWVGFCEAMLDLGMERGTLRDYTINDRLYADPDGPTVFEVSIHKQHCSHKSIRRVTYDPATNKLYGKEWGMEDIKAGIAEPLKGF